MNLNAGKLFENALESLAVSVRPPPGVTEFAAASASILFAHISTEGFINELGMLANLWRERPDAPGWIGALADALELTEDSHIQVESKYQLAKFVLSGRTFDKGALPFQHFSILVKLRNIIVHAKPMQAISQENESGKVEYLEPKLLVQLQQAGVVDAGDSLFEALREQLKGQPIGTNFLHQISTTNVALWACTTAGKIVSGVLDSIPEETDFRKAVRGVYAIFGKEINLVA